MSTPDDMIEELVMTGDHGTITLTFAQDLAEGGEIRVRIGADILIWHVETSDGEGAEHMLCGMTHGSVPVWGDVFWFCLDRFTPRLELWGDQVLVDTLRLAI